ncbi:flavin reductase family protein [Microbacterium karelineae]|uniref:flavin reductase family protein n=1 Tax=Microbacterium karelineae TaxID=2654283 RepID=UPI0012EA9503|nr:flavin reductase family protein [Microbacterium karelineae]
MSTSQTQIPGVEARAFRSAMGRYASGVTVVTGHDGAEPVGFTCQSFYSVSIEPMLVSFCVMKTSTSYPRIRSSGRFAVNVLAGEQEEVSTRFARKGVDKWAGLEWGMSGAGNPLLPGALLSVCCRLWAEHDAGDHWIVLGEVQQVSMPDEPSDPLLFYRGAYHRLAALGSAA